MTKNITDVLPFSEAYTVSWACVLDKGYHGAAETLRPLYPVKNPKHSELTGDQMESNRKHSTNRNIVGFLEDSARYGD